VGQDNDPRGFHTNYRAIQVALATARSEITALQNSVSTLFSGNISFDTNASTIQNLGTISTINLTLSGALQFAQMTTAVRDEIDAVNGMMIYNSSFNKFQGYADGAWGNITLT
jgi:hypothetical protein